MVTQDVRNAGFFDIFNRVESLVELSNTQNIQRHIKL